MPILFCLILLVPSIALAALSDDGYHFSDYETSPNVADYGEWWYFNFNQENIQGVIQYSLWDPAGLTADSYGLMYVSIFYEEETLDLFFPVPWDYIMTSEDTANLVMGPETITVSDGTYTIQGFVADLQGNTVSWSLQYTQTVQSLDVETFNMSPDPNEEMNWYSQMPSATVLGVVVINETPVSINATGYHDHNWGAWKLYNGLWNWFQTSTQDLTIVGYDLYNLKEGAITAIFDEKEITFKEKKYRIINCGWEFNPEAFQPYPTKTLVFAKSKGYFLFLEITVEQTGLVGRFYGEEGIAWTVFESTASFKGVLFGHGSCKRIDSVGFREYSTSIQVPPM